MIKEVHFKSLEAPDYGQGLFFTEEFHTKNTKKTKLTKGKRGLLFVIFE